MLARLEIQGPTPTTFFLLLRFEFLPLARCLDLIALFEHARREGAGAIGSRVATGTNDFDFSNAEVKKKTNKPLELLSLLVVSLNRRIRRACPCCLGWRCPRRASACRRMCGRLRCVCVFFLRGVFGGCMWGVWAWRGRVQR